LAETDEKITNNLQQLGRLYGEMIQIHDDLNDTMAVPANPDWLQKRKPLPILYALTVEHPDRARFIELYKDVLVGNSLQEAQEILLRCGAVSYCVDQLLRRHQAAQKILARTPLVNRGAIEPLIEGAIAPVWKLFEVLDVPIRVLPTEMRALNSE
jgi:geranylgeranyl pyrophosphate synthase